eukprot:TRINITY_DN92898_c0_g1_i1.p1 TRINITY_DN92898_c0_g1~~TRINITY_DN92898_c0_g1_i1.p1  ORF type:complete len:359 (-),score=68.77 TRINITY_DN92898_c0_g1_i1:54-1130(-)
MSGVLKRFLPSGTWRNSSKEVALPEIKTKEGAAAAKTLPPLKTQQPKEMLLIFVDIDGVLNIGIKDGPAHPLSLSRENLEKALSLPRSLLRGPDGQSAARILAAAEKSLQEKGEAGLTYGDFASGRDVDVAEEMVKRLAKILKAAGPRKLVVLSSTWRQPKHAQRVAKLEALVSKHLGQQFVFDDRTDLNEEVGAAGRLKGIGSYLRQHSERVGSDTGLRVLVLEDFHISPMGSWKCEGRDITSVEVAQDYLRRCSSGNVNTSVRLIHTYDEWQTRQGLMQLGSGLTINNYMSALQFVRQSSPRTPPHKVHPEDITGSAVPQDDGTSTADSEEELNSGRSGINSRDTENSFVRLVTLP